MSDQTAVPDDGKQNPLVHEGGETDEVDSNERGDEKVSVQQPSGGDVPRADRQ